MVRPSRSNCLGSSKWLVLGRCSLQPSGSFRFLPSRSVTPGIKRLPSRRVCPPGRDLEGQVRKSQVRCFKKPTTAALRAGGTAPAAPATMAECQSQWHYSSSFWMRNGQHSIELSLLCNFIFGAFGKIRIGSYLIYLRFSNYNSRNSILLSG